YLLFVLKGDVKIYNLTAEGNFIPCILASEGSVLGNLEFFGNETSSFFCEADSQVLCLGLPIARYKTILANDKKFLHFLIQSLTHMVNIISAREQPSLTLSDKLVFYLKNETVDHAFTGMDQMALKLGSSRRQLQRVVKDLCEKEVLKRIARGTYSL
ncbi:MAG: hypothetical protein HUJ72_02520, partial [Blautia sp.]|nr:hypothetical protein [Blautia sp.]